MDNGEYARIDFEVLVSEANVELLCAKYKIDGDISLTIIKTIEPRQLDYSKKR